MVASRSNGRGRTVFRYRKHPDRIDRARLRDLSQPDRKAPRCCFGSLGKARWDENLEEDSSKDAGSRLKWAHHWFQSRDGCEENRLIGKALDHVNEADFTSLVSSRVSEGRSIEFKRELPGGSDADIKEFLADVTSLANAQGGDLVFGIEEVEGIANKVAGMAASDVDAAILRLENLLRDGIEPRLSGVRMKWVELPANRGGLIVRVPASLASPHRIRFKNSGRFYNRNSRGKYEMDTHELRVAFTASEHMPTRLRQLHATAVKAARGEGLPFRLNDEPMTVASVIPLAFLRELHDLQPTPETAMAPERVSGGLDWLHMLEGLLVHTPLTPERTVRAFAITHRAGRIDSAWTIGGLRELGDQTEKVVFPQYFRKGVLNVARFATGKLRGMGVEGPWVMFVTVYGLADFRIWVHSHEQSEPAWKNEVTFPEILADDLAEDALSGLLNAFPLLFGIPSQEYSYPE